MVDEFIIKRSLIDFIFSSYKRLCSPKSRLHGYIDVSYLYLRVYVVSFFVTVGFILVTVMNYVRLSPQPAQFHTMPAWFAPRVEVDTDRLTIERGVWLACTPQLADSITRRAEHKVCD